MADSTFATPDLTTFARLDRLGLQVTGQFLEPDRAVLELPGCRRRHRCAGAAARRAAAGHHPATFAHEPFGWRPTILLVTVRRYRCELRPCVAAGHVADGRTAGPVVPRRRCGGR